MLRPWNTARLSPRNHSPHDTLKRHWNTILDQLSWSGLTIKPSTCQLRRPATCTPHTHPGIPLEFSPGLIALAWVLNQRRVTSTTRPLPSSTQPASARSTATAHGSTPPHSRREKGVPFQSSNPPTHRHHDTTARHAPNALGLTVAPGPGHRTMDHRRQQPNPAARGHRGDAHGWRPA